MLWMKIGFICSARSLQLFSEHCPRIVPLPDPCRFETLLITHILPTESGSIEATLDPDQLFLRLPRYTET